MVYRGPPDGYSWLSLREAQSDAHEVPYDRYGIGLHHLAFTAPSRDVVDECDGIKLEIVRRRAS